MFLSTLAVQRPVLATVVNLLLLVMGIGALMRLPVRQFPNIDPPVITISTNYTGATAAVVESQITKRIEDAVAGIEGIRTIQSVSRDEASQIEIEFLLSRELSAAAADVRDQLGRVRKQLPDTADEPVVDKATTGGLATMWVGLASDTRDTAALTDFARRGMLDKISVVPGVARVIVAGERRYAMRVWLDREAMTNRNVTVADIVTRLNQENVELPGGRLESDQREMTVRTTTRMNTPLQFEQLIVRDLSAGSVNNSGPVRLGDVARIEIGAANYRTGFFISGKPGIGLGVVRQSTANALDVSKGVRAAVADMRASIPADITASLPFDESVFIEASIKEVLTTLSIAVALVVGVILLFLRSLRSTVIPVLAIPVSLVAAAIVMAGMGYSVNVLTLLALVLAIGLVVDDAIVVLENIHRRIELGEPRLLAAVTGSGEVGFAVIATTAVLVAVFIPLSFMEGRVGRLFTEFGVTLAATVVFSAVVALTLTPMLCSRLLSEHDTNNHTHREGPVARGLDAAFRAVENGYRRLLDIALSWWGVTVIIGALVSFAGLGLYRVVPDEFAPIEDRGYMFIPLEAPQGSTIDYTQARVKEVEVVLQPLLDEAGTDPAKPLASILSIVAPSFSVATSPNQATIVARLKHWSQRTTTQQAVSKQLSGQLLALPGAFAIAINPPSFGLKGTSQALQVALGGQDLGEVQGWARTLIAKMRTNPGFVQPRDTNTDLTRPQLEVAIDRDRAAAAGIPISDIGDALQVMLGSQQITRYEDRNEQYDVIVQARAEDRRVPSDLTALYVRSHTSGQLIPLANLVQPRQVGAPKELDRTDRLPSVTITANLTPGYPLGTALQWMRDSMRSDLPPQARLIFQGQSREQTDSSSGLYVTFALALVIVFLVLAAQFESWVHPFIILTSVPLATAGALGALLLTGQTLNIYSKIGLIMLIGLMAKNGILVVEFANQLRDRGESIADAIRHAAAVRLRPILMTSIATIAGAVPLWLAHGAGAEGRSAIGVVIVGGMALATGLTLFVVPVLYLLLARFTRPAGAIARRLSEIQNKPPEGTAS